jgi:3-deoxy-7-phosphoheptulonate synthase
MSVSSPHRFLGINNEGQVSIIRTKGNQYGHVVLRGGSAGPNYDSASVKLCEEALKKAGLQQNIMIDCSHANSSKDPNRQPLVVEDVIGQIHEGNQSIVGFMIESHLGFGNQSIPDNLADLQYGVSITDACIDWETTEKCITNLADKLRETLPKRLTK